MRNTNTPIRVIVGDDSGFIRILLSDYLRQDKEVELVGLAANGKEVVDLAMKVRPDVVITDLVMPDYDGVYAVQSLMKLNPLPIVLLSSLSRTDQRVFDALAAGAAEFMGKPQGQPMPKGAYAQRLLGLIKTLAQQESGGVKPSATTVIQGPLSVPKEVKHRVVVIGASTGGPAVLENLVRHLPEGMPVPVVIAQHMPHMFLQAFAKRLNGLSKLTVQVAEEGEVLKPGNVYFSHGEANLCLEYRRASKLIRASYTSESWDEFNFPSVDCLFHSASKAMGSEVLGVILTGMGRDGGRGLEAIAKAGGCTMGQDEDSCVVYGMPAFARSKNAVQHTVSATTLPEKLLTLL